MSEEQTKRRKGFIYTPINDLWTPAREPFEGAYENFCRSEKEMNDTGIRAYQELAADAKQVKIMSKNQTQKDALVDTESSTSFSGSEASENDKEWKPKKPTTIPRDYLLNRGASRGHCFPTDGVCAGAYGVLGQGIVGAPEMENFGHHGISREDAIVALRTLVYGIRKGATGLKNLPQNALPLPSDHYGDFDRDSNWLIVPCMTLQQAREWKGNDYWALAICGNKPGHVSRNLADINQTAGADAYQEAYNQSDDNEIFESLLRGNVHEENRYLDPCGEQDIRNATSLLSDCVKAIADVVNRDDMPPAIPKNTGNDPGNDNDNAGKHQSTGPIAPSELLFSRKQNDADSVEKIRNFCKRAKGFYLKDATVEVPTIAESLKLSEVVAVKVHVRQIQGIDGIVDPLILAIKAAVNWSNRLAPADDPTLKLLPACGPVVAFEDSSDGALEMPWDDETSHRFSAQPFVAEKEELQPIPGMMLSRFLEELHTDPNNLHLH